MQTTIANVDTAQAAGAVDAARANPSATSSATAAAENMGASMHHWLLEKVKAVSPSLYDTLSLPVLGSQNTILDWLVMVVTVAAAMLVFWLVRRLLVTRVKSLAERTTTKWDDVIVDALLDLKWFLFLPLAVLVGAGGLQIGYTIHLWMRGIAVACLAAQLILTSRLFIDFGTRQLIARSTHEDGRPDPAVETSLGVMRFVVAAIVATLVILLALDNLGIQVTPLLASLGIGGIAVALAAQNILGDLFASMTILFDKPFVVGDAIKVGDKEGTVERIGIKTTRLRAPSGEQLVFSNIELTKNCLHNFKRLEQRRIAFGTSVTYDTPVERLREIPALIRAAVEKQKLTRFDRCHLKTLAAYSLDFETVYFVTTGDYMAYMNAQQGINLELVEAFRSRGIDFAMPTQVAMTPRQQIEGKPGAATTVTRGA
ncbi:MAG: mechanosensitive ion channel family protein [Phycisphaerales bacterium]